MYINKNLPIYRLQVTKTTRHFFTQLFLLGLIVLTTLLSACGTTNLESLLESSTETIETTSLIESPSASENISKKPLPTIRIFSSSHYKVPAPHKIHLNFVTNDVVDRLELSYSNTTVDVTGKTEISIDVVSSTTFSLHAYNTHGHISTSLSIQVGNIPFSLELNQVLRLRAADLNNRLTITSTVPEGYELVTMAIREIGDTSINNINIEHNGLTPDHTTNELHTQPHSDFPHSSSNGTHLLLESTLIASSTLRAQNNTVCNYPIGKICEFYILTLDNITNKKVLEKKNFKLLKQQNGVSFFVDTVDLIGSSILENTINQLGLCASFVVSRHFKKEFISSTDIDNSGGVSFLLSTSLPFNGLVRWDDVNPLASNGTNQADIAYINTEHIYNLSPLGLATFYEELFHVYHLAYRATNELSRPNRFEAETLIATLLNNIRLDNSIPSICGGNANDGGKDIEIAIGYFSLTNIFLNRPYKCNVFGDTPSDLQMTEYGIGRMLGLVMSFRDDVFIENVITSQHSKHKTWSSLEDGQRVYEDAWLSLILAANPKFKGYNLPKNYYTSKDKNYDFLSNIQARSLSTAKHLQSNESIIILSGKPKTANGIVNLNIDFDKGSFVAFLRPIQK